MGLPQRDLIVLLSGPVILLLRFLICNSGSGIKDTAVCSTDNLVILLNMKMPWEAFYKLQPLAWSDPSVVVLLLACLTALAALSFVFIQIAPKTPTVYIQPTAGLKDLLLRGVSMFLRAAFAIAYFWKYWQKYGSDAVPEAHHLAMNAIVSHYIVRGIEALLLRRYSAPFFPPQLSHPFPVLCGVFVYLYHFFLILVHFQWMSGTPFAEWKDLGIGQLNEPWMYVGYGVAVFGQVLMLKQADSIPKSSLRTGFVWRGEVVSWVGIGFISQHPGVWLLVLTMVPFSYCEELVEMWTGQRYARLCTPLRSSCAVLFKDAPALAETVAPALLEAGAQYGEVELCVVRPRSTQETSDVYLVFANEDDAGMAKSSMDGKTFAGWRANALHKRCY